MDAVNSGDSAEAERIADLLFATGLYEQENLDQWIKTAGKESEIPEGYDGTTTNDLYRALDALNRTDSTNMKTALLATGMTKDELADALEEEFKPMYWDALTDRDFEHWDEVKAEIIALNVGIDSDTYSEWMSEYIRTYGRPSWMLSN